MQSTISELMSLCAHLQWAFGTLAIHKLGLLFESVHKEGVSFAASSALSDRQAGAISKLTILSRLRLMVRTALRMSSRSARMIIVRRILVSVLPRLNVKWFGRCRIYSSANEDVFAPSGLLVKKQFARRFLA